MLNVKSFGITCGIFWASVSVWATLLMVWGKGMMPFEWLDQFYLGWLLPTYAGLALNAAITFVDGLVFGLLFALVYNKIAK